MILKNVEAVFLDYAMAEPLREKNLKIFIYDRY